MSRFLEVPSPFIAAAAWLEQACPSAESPPVPPLPPKAAAAAKTNQQTYQVKGVIQELQPERNKVKISQRISPASMEAMTMLLDVKDAAELRAGTRRPGVLSHDCHGR
jgi:hypothetical protein